VVDLIDDSAAVMDGHSTTLEEIGFTDNRSLLVLIDEPHGI